MNSYDYNDEQKKKIWDRYKDISSRYRFSWDMAKHEIIPAEQDENGTYYGYKFLVRLNNILFESPSRPIRWILGRPVESDVEPAEYNRHGIYACKNLDILIDEWYFTYSRRTGIVAVKVALFGNIVIETEKGFRADMAQIVEVLNEHW